MFSDVTLHALVTSMDHSFAVSVHSFPYQIDPFKPHNFQLCLLSECDGSKVGSRHKKNDMKHYAAARFN